MALGDPVPELAVHRQVGGDAERVAVEIEAPADRRGAVDDQVELNDIVILPPHTGTPIEEDGVKYLVVYEDQILAVLDREATG